ncbi:MAG: hypothetical protein ACOX2R_01445 [Anaerolineae bacterium]|jgi:hypothetical protein
MQVNADRHEAQRPIMAAQGKDAPVHPELECPCCGETQQAKLLWLDMERVRCSCCGATFHVWENRAD